MRTAERVHDFSYGHRVHNHESKCAHLHGHNGRVKFVVTAPELDALGRIMDFGVIKERLCSWLEDNWDHKFLAWEEDPLMQTMLYAASDTQSGQMLEASIVWVPFNPTAENMAQYLVDVIGPKQLAGTEVTLISVTFDETRKCSCTHSLENFYVSSI
jgi:6-pyruvoyltetrahydropterin/6-carboxytetrahydropterin synthase